MDFKQALGQAIREARLSAGLTRDDFGGITPRSYMHEIENGLTAISVDKLFDMSQRLGLTPSQLVLVAEARLAEQDLSTYLATHIADLTARVKVGHFEEVNPEQARLGMRGRKANLTRDEVGRLYSMGKGRTEIAKLLNISTRTVDRYKRKENSD